MQHDSKIGIKNNFSFLSPKKNFPNQFYTIKYFESLTLPSTAADFFHKGSRRSLFFGRIVDLHNILNMYAFVLRLIIMH